MGEFDSDGESVKIEARQKVSGVIYSNMQKNVEVLQKVTDELLGLMATKAKAEVSYDKENEAFTVNIDAGDETGLLIGKKGETLLGIQTILGFLLKQKTGEWNRFWLMLVITEKKKRIILKTWRQVPPKGQKRQGNPKTFIT